MDSVLRLIYFVLLEISLDLVLLLFEALSLLLFISVVIENMVLLIGVSSDEVFFSGVGVCDFFVALAVAVEGFGVFVGLCVVDFLIEVLMVVCVGTGIVLCFSFFVGPVAYVIDIF